MRWEALFADLENQLAAAATVDHVQEVAELTRAERATVALMDRLRADLGSTVSVSVRGGSSVCGALVEVGSAWVLIGDTPREHLVPAHAIVSVSGTDGVVAPPAGPVLRRLGLGHALRAVARDRSLVTAVTLAGEVRGRVDAVGSDHFEVASILVDTGRPSGARTIVTFTGLDLLTGG